MDKRSKRKGRLLALLLLCGLNVGLTRGGELTGLVPLARSILGADQGVYIESADGTMLLAQAADVAVHPASVSKVPTTLALLRKLGPEYRFVTTFSASGPVRGLTWPILMTLACALAELALSSAGMAIAAAPVLISVRRLMR